MTIAVPDEFKDKEINSMTLFIILRDILAREEQIDQEKEHFWMIGLAINNRLLFIELVSLGSVKATTVEPMNVFRVSVLKGAVKAIIGHNHPSGNLQPSEADLDVTDRLIQVGRILDIPIIDHMLITTNDYFSFAEEGLIEKLGESTKWVPSFVLEKRIRDEESKLRNKAVRVAENKGKKEGIKEGKLATAKSMKDKGYSIEEISEITGLKKKEIEGL